MNKQVWWVVVAACVVAALAVPMPVQAHAGPPYIVLPQQAVGPYTLTVWTDPDIGTGTFLIEPASAGLPPNTTITVTVRPEDGHRAPNTVAAVPQAQADGTYFVARTPFDTGGMWATEVVVDGPQGRGAATFSVKVTPPYPGWIESLPCLLPFVGLGMLWWIGVRRQRRAVGTPVGAAVDGGPHAANGASL